MFMNTLQEFLLSGNARVDFLVPYDRDALGFAVQSEFSLGYATKHATRCVFLHCNSQIRSIINFTGVCFVLMSLSMNVRSVNDAFS